MNRIIGYLAVVSGLIVGGNVRPWFHQNWRIGCAVSAFLIVVGGAFLGRTVGNDFKMLAKLAGRWLRRLFHRP
jgi:hypothetical protein